MHISRAARFGSGLLALLLTTSVAAQAQPASKPARLFDEKSGVVEMKMSMMGMEPKMTLYFDDYGQRTVTIIRMSMMGRNSVQHVIATNDSTIQWDEETMQGMRAAKSEANQTMSLTAYNNMDPARKKALGYRKLGTKKVLGKSATGFSIDTSGATMKIWQWKNIPLYMEANGQGMSITFEATRISVPSAVPASVFVVPAGVKFAESSLGSPGEGEGMGSGPVTLQPEQ